MRARWDRFYRSYQAVFPMWAGLYLATLVAARVSTDVLVIIGIVSLWLVRQDAKR